jgi:hypothetical protein
MDALYKSVDVQVYGIIPPPHGSSALNIEADAKKEAR